MDSVTNQTLAHICISERCHCDWRLSIYGCEESKPMFTIYIVHIIISSINLILGSIILYNRLFVIGYSLFSRNFRQQGPFGSFFIRIRPLECLLTFVFLFCSLRILSSTLLIADIGVDHIIFRSWLSEFCWQVGFSGCTLYLVGVVQLIVDSNEGLFLTWLPGKRTINAIAYWILFSPLIMNNIFSILAGVFAVHNQQYEADLATRLLYLMWVINCIISGVSVIFAGARLVKIMNRYLFSLGQGTTKYKMVKYTLFRIKTTLILLVICITGFATFLFFYFLLRIRILTDTTGSIVLGTIWNLFADGMILLFESILLISPDINNNTYILKVTNSENQSNLEGQYDKHNTNQQEHHYHHRQTSYNHGQNTTNITMTETVGELFVIDNDSQEDLVKHLQKINDQVYDNNSHQL
ncbi:unnamed protein product [Cunninghamella echinulata]